MAIYAPYPDSEDRSRWDAAEICLKCGVCCVVSHSCHVMYDRQFDPRYTFVYDCLGSEEGPANPNIWLCVSCHKCEEVCPYEVSPIRLIEALKSEAMHRGSVHPLIRAELAQIVSTGYAFPLTGATDRQRKGLNLNSLEPRGTSDLAKLIERTGLAEKLKEAPS